MFFYNHVHYTYTKDTSEYWTSENYVLKFGGGKNLQKLL